MKIESSNTDFKKYRMFRRINGDLYFKDYYINAEVPRTDQAMLLKFARHKFKKFLAERVEK